MPSLFNMPSLNLKKICQFRYLMDLADIFFLPIGCNCELGLPKKPTADATDVRYFPLQAFTPHKDITLRDLTLRDFVYTDIKKIHITGSNYMYICKMTPATPTSSISANPDIYQSKLQFCHCQINEYLCIFFVGYTTEINTNSSLYKILSSLYDEHSEYPENLIDSVINNVINLIC